jgi:hypothetical protein
MAVVVTTTLRRGMLEGGTTWENENASFFGVNSTCGWW